MDDIEKQEVDRFCNMQVTLYVEIQTYKCLSSNPYCMNM